MYNMDILKYIMHIYSCKTASFNLLAVICLIKFKSAHKQQRLKNSLLEMNEFWTTLPVMLVNTAKTVLAIQV